MAQPSWHGARGGGRGKSSQWSSGTVRRDLLSGGGRGPGFDRLDVRANVRTPAIAAAAAASSGQQPPVRGSAVVAAGNDGAIASAERPAASALTKMATPASMPPAVKARTSTRQAAETAEAASKQSTAQIEAHLEEVEKRLSVVIAQEEEVRAIADEHLEREVALKTLLEDLYQESQEELEPAPSQVAPSPSEASPSAASVTTPAPDGGSPGAGEAAAGSPNGGEPTDKVSRLGSGAPPHPAGKTPSAAAAHPARREDGQAGTSGKRSSRGSSRSSQRGAGAAGAAAPSASTTSGRGASLGLLLAVAAGGSADSLLTRDADTVAEYIRLMSDEALKDHDSASSKRWSQPGLSLSEALDRMEAKASCPPRTPNLLALAALIRPPLTIGRVGKSPSPNLGVGKRGREDAQGAAAVALAGRGVLRSTSADSDSSIAAAPAAAIEGAAEAEAEGVERAAKRRCIDPNAIMCPFELNGRCNDDDCRYQHLDVYLSPPSPADTLAPTAVAPAAVAASAAGAPVTRAVARAASSVSRPEGRGLGKEPRAGSATAPAGAGPQAAGEALLPAAGKRPARRLVGPPPEQGLPAIEFWEPEGEEPRDVPRSRGQRAKRSRPSDAEVSHTGVEAAGTGDTGGDGGGGGGGGEKAAALDGENEDKDGDDFMALPTGGLGLARSGSNGGGSAGVFDNERPGPTNTVAGADEAPAAAAAALAERASPAAFARAFAQAASGAATGGRGNSGGGVGGKGRGAGARREERYYKGGDEIGRPAAAALTEAQLEYLEAQLGEGDCDVEGWLLLAIHRLPRRENSAGAVLDTVEAVARGAGGALKGVGDAALKPALRTFVRALERAARGQGEALWLLYLRLFALLPGKNEDAVSMVEHALEIFPTSRRIWRLYRYMLRRSDHRQSLPDVIKTYRRQIAALLLLRGPAAAAAEAAAAPPTPAQASPRAAVGTGTEAADSASKGLRTPGAAGGGDDGGIGGGDDGGIGGGGGGGGDHADATVGMIVYLVLECCAALAEAGYTLQAAAEVLDALGDGKPLRGWDAAEGHEGGPLLRLPLYQGGVGDGAGGGGGGVRELFPEGVADALKRARSDLRCLLWLAALHLLVMGVFPQHVLSLAAAAATTDDDNGTDSNNADSDKEPRDDRGWRRPDLLQWPKEWLSLKGDAGARLSASAELFEVISKTFMSALLDAGLLPPEKGAGKGWAPPLRVRDAVFPSAMEAAAARTAGTAPDVSALEGPPLALALNWLTFCSRGRVGAKGVRMVALACCRRFQLARPDHPAMLEHLLLEHGVSKARPLGDVYREISSAFDQGGAAAAALRERGDEAPGGAGNDSSDKRHPPPSSSSSSSFPTGARLQAVYAFLRVVEMRLQAAADAPSLPPPPLHAKTGGDDGVVGGSVEASAATVAGTEEEGADLEVARDALLVALVGMWAPTPATTAVPHRWLQEDGESQRLAVEGARASLFRWADVATHGGAGVGSGKAGSSGGRSSSRYDALSAERQLSTIVFGLWVLGGASAATDALDHLLSAESFSTISPELRRLAWLQRLETAVVLSTQQVPGEHAMQGVREVALRALADHRTQRRPEYRTLSHFVASTLDLSVSGLANSGDGSSGGGKTEIASAFPFSATASTSSSPSSFARDVLTVYANRFREVRGGVDWVVVAEALGSGESSAAVAAASRSSYSPPSDQATAETTCALLRWVSWADEPAAAAGPSGEPISEGTAATAAAVGAAAAAAAAADSASALRRNARPYAEKALAKHPRDTGLACAVAALEASTNRPDRGQRILEAALRASPHCSTLWEQRVALEAGFGAGSKERADSTASAAASTQVLLRLFYGEGRGGAGLGSVASRGGSSLAPSPPPPHPSALQARTACRVFAAATNPLSRRQTKSLSLQGALQTPEKPAGAGAAATAATTGSEVGARREREGHLLIPTPVEVPRSVFLLTGLVSLSLANNGLAALPHAIGRLLCLRSLDVSGNALTALPPSLSRLSGSLRVLRVARNRLTSPLPAAPLTGLVSLRVLDLEHNALSEFPEAVVLALTELRSLKLAGNGFPSRAPTGLSDALPHLEDLSLP